MDDQQTGVNPDVGEVADITPAPSVENKAPVEETLPEDNSNPTSEEASNESESKEEAPSKKGAEARIRELNTKAKLAEEKAQSLAQELEKLTGVPDQGYQSYTPQAQPGEEISPEQYQADVTKTADALVQLRLNQYKIVEKINSEANSAIKDHPELDPSSDQFDRELNDTVTEATLAYVRSNPTASVRKFVDKLMKPYKRSLAKEVANETETITKQIASQSLRPTPSTKGVSKSDSEKTIEELEKELGVVY